MTHGRAPILIDERVEVKINLNSLYPRPVTLWSPERYEGHADAYYANVLGALGLGPTSHLRGWLVPHIRASRAVPVCLCYASAALHDEKVYPLHKAPSVRTAYRPYCI